MKLKKLGCLAALSSGLFLFGSHFAYAETPYNTVKEQFQKEKAGSIKSKSLTSLENSTIDRLLKSEIRSPGTVKAKELTGNTYYESEPNDDLYDANYLGQGDVMLGSFSDYDIDTFRINVPETKSGLISVAGAMSPDSLSDIGFVLYDSNDQPVDYVDYITDDHLMAVSYDVPPGTYYIKAINIGAYTTADSYGLAWDVYTFDEDATPPSPPQVNRVDDNDTVVTGTAEPDSYIDVSVNGYTIGSGLTGADGKFSVAIPALQAGSELDITATDVAGNTSAYTSVLIVKSNFTGWTTENGKRYYYTNGAKNTGWLFYNNKWYFLDKNTGQMKIGWVLSNNKWYFLDKKTGVMTTGWVLDGSKWYYMDNYGVMKTGWLKYGKDWYYLNKNGSMATGWVYVNGKWYYLYSSGKMAYSTKIGSYRLGADGAWIKLI